MAVAPPFTLPLLRVIRESRLPGEASRIHEAEFLLGNLVAATGNRDDRIADPDSVVYDFRSPQLRALFRSGMPVDEAKEVLALDEVGEYLGRRLGMSGSLAGMLRAPENYAGKLNLAPAGDTDAFARFTKDALEWFGNEHAGLLREAKTTADWKDFESVVWYVEAASSADTLIRGSAVAVRLRRSGGRPKTWLLTCANFGRDMEPGAVAGGPATLYALHGWRPGTRFVAVQGRALRVAARSAPRAVDWTLFEFVDEPDGSAPAVPLWAESDPSGPCLISGHTGEQTLNETLRAVRLNRWSLAGSDAGVLRFRGGEARPRSNGAGVFDSTGAFVGILTFVSLRSQSETMEVVAASAALLRQQLREQGYEVVTGEEQEDSGQVVELALILRSQVYQDHNWAGLFYFASLNYSEQAIPEGLDEDGARLFAVEQLAKLGTDSHGVYYLHQFVIDLQSVRPSNALAEWIAKYVPTFADPPEPKLPVISVLVAGTGKYSLPPAVHDAAERVGRWAAANGFGLVTGGWQGVDYVAAEAYAKALDPALPIERWLTHVVERGAEPDFKQGAVVHVGTELEQFERAIGLAKTVIAVGGLGGVRDVSEHALRLQVPVFPLAWTGGDAGGIYNRVLSGWDSLRCYIIPRDRFEQLKEPSEALKIVAEQLLPVQPESKPPKPPPPKDYAPAMMFVSSKPRIGQIRTDEELRAIGAIFRETKLGHLRFEFRFDTTWEDLHAALVAVRPILLHFCGYSLRRQFVFRDATNGPQYVTPEEFALLVGGIGSLRVIVLNADSAEAFASAVMKRLPDCVVIAPDRIVTDDHAIRFARDFYGHISAGASVGRAFKNATYPGEGRAGGAYSLSSNTADPDAMAATNAFEYPGRKTAAASDSTPADWSEPDDWTNHILWVDDWPNNLVLERRAFETIGLRFTLALSTNEAIKAMSQSKFAAIISDMGRKEGPRQGYVLLDHIRKEGNRTPLFFYASSNSPEHKRETREHGGQGCTNDAQELFDMVMQAVSGRVPELEVWTLSQMQRSLFVKLISQHFEMNELSILATIYLNIDLNEFAKGEKFTSKVVHLLELVTAQHRVKELMTAVSVARPGQAEIQDFIASVLGSQSTVWKSTLDLRSSCWRYPKKDAEFLGHKMYCFHIILEATDTILDRIESVTYRMSSSHPQPVRTVTDRGSKFKLKELAWGGFDIAAEIRTMGQKTLKLTHRLDLTETGPRI
jgi:CheY-like chemotaxis protein